MALRKASCPPSFIMYRIPMGAMKYARLESFNIVIRR